MTAASPEDLLSELRRVFGARCATSAAQLDHHAHDESWHPARPPDAVVYPETTQEVSVILRLCTEHGVPAIPFGTGSSMEGSVNAVQGGISIDTSRMSRILEVNDFDFDCRVEAGVSHEALNTDLRDRGLFFPVDLGAHASLGGMAATRASGTMTLRYGSMRENVIGLEVVLADGAVIRTGGRARKSSSGYDLTRLFVGSEGTLGVITEVVLRLHPRPNTVVAAMVPMPDLTSAVDLVQTLMVSGLPLARLELMDELEMEAANRYLGEAHALRPTLFLELHLADEDGGRNGQLLEELCRDHHCEDFHAASKAEDRSRIWRARHKAAFAELTLRPGSRALVTDVCVPLSSLAGSILAAKEDLAQSGLIGPLVGHVGDGNYHIALLIDPANQKEIACAEAFHDRLVMRALAAGGNLYR
jgi:D-lactate dehydrogenase (cytochrome)